MLEIVKMCRTSAVERVAGPLLNVVGGTSARR